MKNKKVNNFNYLQYSNESIKLKQRIIYFLILALKICALTPTLRIIISDILIDKYLLLPYSISKFSLIISLLISITLAFLTTKREVIKNPLFLDDKVIVSNRQKNNGVYENIYLDKFKLLVGFNLICIVPLCFITSLCISSIIVTILKLFSEILFILNSLKCLITIILLRILFVMFNDVFLVYLRNKKE